MAIQGVTIKKMSRFLDQRGWLSECFRDDEIDKDIHPVMAYVSMTLPGITRGPHEHLYQTDYFCFAGPSEFKIYIWDNREGSPTYNEKLVLTAGENNPAIVVVPPKVVHAYKNIGRKEGLVLNFPNKLYGGKNKKEAVDEVRYEDDADSRFKVDE